jgi:6-phosphogluconolactonase (cycloisomerase 2 family)
MIYTQNFMYSRKAPIVLFPNQQTIYCTPEIKSDVITYNYFVSE